ncbi:MAG: protein phosphatase [Pelagimonas sp.]|jgi:hypothetical protein|nr:protein phosphatase [Pelagimonas sp.]
MMGDTIIVRMMAVGGGIVAMSGLPGMRGDLKGDLDHITGLKPSFVVTAVTRAELEATRSSDLQQYVQDRGARWVHMPVEPGQVPDIETSYLWEAASKDLQRALLGGGRIFVHGLQNGDRAGMFVLRLMIETGEAADDALGRLKSVWPEALTCASQLNWAMEAAREPALFVRHRA